VKAEDGTDAGCVSSRRVYTGRIISLDVDAVRLPDGSTAELEMVRHPGASAVVPFVDDIAAPDPGVLLIRQYRYAANGFVYEIPAGRLDVGESPETCAHRELREETGYSAREVVPLTTFYTTPGFTDERIHLFVAMGLNSGESALEADEFLDPALIPLSRALEMVRSGQVMDGKTIIGLLFAAAFARAG
jgi:ADP-ribose pyrophosphatase